MPSGIYERTEVHRKITSEAIKNSEKAMSAARENGRTQGKLSFKGELRSVHNGYIFKYCPEHPNAISGSYVYYHRWLVEQQIGRYLLTEEIVHHENCDESDNRIQNLMAFVSQRVHRLWHMKPELVKPEEIIFDGRNLYAV